MGGPSLYDARGERVWPGGDKKALTADDGEKAAVTSYIRPACRMKGRRERAREDFASLATCEKGRAPEWSAALGVFGSDSV